ncbi:MAG: hypothetical protein HQK84_03315 [Nitrospinae bacterium]|nr:hypothetical protein [Nitrospinota bacterium]
MEQIELKKNGLVNPVLIHSLPRNAIVKDGKITVCGTILELYTHPFFGL